MFLILFFFLSVQLVKEVFKSLSDGLEKCDSSDETCRLRYLRALRNLAHPDSVALLLNHALNGTRKTTVAAMKALVALPKASWDSKVSFNLLFNKY